MDGPAIRQWLTALDHLSFYELFRVTPQASFDDLRHAFHAFAEIFHPDAHTWRPEGERAGIGYIFRRGTEAYRVLADPQLRVRYDEALANGILRPESLVIEADGGGPRSLAPAAMQSLRLVDRVKNPGARPFVLRAEELLKKGDPKQAKIQLVMALHMDRGNAALEAFGKELDEAVKKLADDAKKAWTKG
jgi:curved DNA-binding protein CbpA